MKVQAIRILGMALILLGVALFVYNLLGYGIGGEGVKVFWDNDTRFWISIGAVAIMAGVLLYRESK